MLLGERPSIKVENVSKAQISEIDLNHYQTVLRACTLIKTKVMWNRRPDFSQWSKFLAKNCPLQKVKLILTIGPYNKRFQCTNFYLGIFQGGFVTEGHPEPGQDVCLLD